MRGEKGLSEFAAQAGKTWRQTWGFRQRYIYEGCSQNSYRQVAGAYKRECFQALSCQRSSFQDMVVRESKKIHVALEQKSQAILQEYGIALKRDKTVVSQPTQDQTGKRIVASKKLVEAAYQKVMANCKGQIKEQLSIDYEAYEAKDQTVHISNDDVCCKKQKDKRVPQTELEKQAKQKEKQRCGGRKRQKQRRFVYQNVTHFEYQNGQYRLIGPKLSSQLGLIIAFLLDNDVLNKNWVFFVDGQRTINECIENRFSWKDIDMVLDWYHLDKKINKQLFHALRACDQRDEILWTLKEFAWYGLVDQAITFIDTIDASLIKKQEELELLKGYFERNRAYIKCYAVRKELGLKLSSNRVEKTNDELVAARQKKNGMSFTRPGSFGLAMLKTLRLNEEHNHWIKHGQIKFKFAA